MGGGAEGEWIGIRQGSGFLIFHFSFLFLTSVGIWASYSHYLTKEEYEGK